MKVIRYNTFRKINFFEKSSFFIQQESFDLGTEKQAFTVDELKWAKRKIANKKLLPSKYNIAQTFLDEKTVILNTLYDSVVVLNADETARYQEIGADVDLSEFILKLYLLGILIDEREDEKFFMKMQNEELFFNRRGIPSITILPTQACNARCAYCFAEHNEKITMNQLVIHNVILFFKENFSAGDRVLLRWFGGEPLVAKDIITEIIDGINETFDGKLLYESLVFTNGSLITDEIIEVATNKWHLKKIQLTLDGYGDEHNARKNYVSNGVDYYKKTLGDIQKLLDCGIHVDCRVNFDKDNIKQIDNILYDLLPYKGNSLFRPRLTILRPSDYGYNKFNYIAPSDLKWAYNIIYNKLYDYGFLTAAKDLLPQRQKESCIAKSLNKVIIGADGNLYKCLQQVFDERHIVGDLKTGIIHRGFVDDYCRKDIHDECEECVYLPICSGGCLAYWKLMENENITPCIREKFFMDMLLEMVHQWESVE